MDTMAGVPHWQPQEPPNRQEMSDEITPSQEPTPVEPLRDLHPRWGISTVTLKSDHTFHDSQVNPNQTLTSFSIKDIAIPEKSLYPGELCASSLTIAEKGWEGYQSEVLPPKTLPKTLRDLRFIVLNVYRRLFTLIILINLAVFAFVVTKRGVPLEHIGNIVLGNITVSILIRQDHIVNGLFWIFTSVPQR